ncbi:MFS transporter [Cellulomonas triticagri]|uniref:MFS transporter n=1 Tax=Cellulomonas triticagri TaxID=2483352 RepID=A0A3M2JKY7_9CELL|nr:MFS transporter [Cellulomonas triticagri]RMI14329.1 MFS transporter [Cellulomonas triticagri]
MSDAARADGAHRHRRVYTPRGRIGIGRAVGFGLTDLLGGGGLAVLGAWMLFFFTTYGGLTALQGASILAIAKFVDAVVSLAIGNITDEFFRTRLGQRFGRRHFFMLIGAPLSATFALLWIAGMGYWYYLAVYLAFEVVLAMVLIPWETLPNEMTTNYDERTKMSTARLVVSGSATFLATAIPTLLFRTMGEDSAAPFLVNGLIFTAIFIAAILISWGTTWETYLAPPAPGSERARIDLRTVVREYTSTLRISTFRKQLSIYLLSFTAMDMWSAVFVYYVVFVLRLDAAAAAGIQSLSFIAIGVTVVAGWLITKISPRSLWAVAFSLVLLSALGWYLVSALSPAHPLPWLTLLGVVYQVGRAVFVFVPWNVFPFVPDVDEMVTGRKRAGVFAAVMTFVRKSTVALATLIIGALLDASGFVDGARVQPESAQSMITLLLSAGVAVLVLAALAVAVTFRLDRHNHAVLAAEVARLRAGGDPAEATPEVRAVVRRLSGVRYEDIRAWDRTPPATAETVAAEARD